MTRNSSISLMLLVLLAACGVTTPTSTKQLTVPEAFVGSVRPNQVSLVWKPVANASAYRISRGEDSAELTDLAEIAASETSFTDRTVNPDTEYHYAIVAVWPDENSGAASLVIKSAPLPGETLTAPVAPSSLTSQAEDGSINLSWAPVDGAVRYEVQRQKDDEPAEILSENVENNLYADTSAESEVKYTYLVSAVNLVGQGKVATVQAMGAKATAATTAPPAPQFKVSYYTSNTVGLSWSTSSRATRYILTRMMGSTPVQIGGNITSTGYTDRNLNPRTTYTYQLQAANSIGLSPAVSVRVTTLSRSSSLQKPATPNVTATATSPTQVKLSWPAVSGATRYGIIRTDGTTVVELCSDFSYTVFYDNSVKAGSAYTYSVAAANAAGTSAYTSVTVQTPKSTLAAPTNLNGSITSSSVFLSWNAVSRATGYVVSRGTNGTFSTLATPSTASYTDLGLSPSTTYTYRIQATNGSLTSSVAEISLTTKVALPTAPASVSASARSSSEVLVSWSSVQGATYVLERQTGTTSMVRIGGNLSITSYTDSDLSPSTTYTYRVAAKNTAGTSVFTRASVTTPAAPQPPATPTGLSATALSSTQVEVGWNPSSGATGYTLERKTGSSSYAPLTTVTGTIYRDGTVRPSTTYGYRLTATNTVGRSSGIEASVTTPAPATTTPPAPSSVQATYSNGSISIAWPAVTGATYYRITFWTGESYTRSTPWSNTATGALGNSTTNTTTHTGFVSGNTYQYTVYAYNDVGASGGTQSNLVTTALKPDYAGPWPQPAPTTVAGHNYGGPLQEISMSCGVLTTSGTNAYSRSLSLHLASRGMDQAQPWERYYGDAKLHILAFYIFRSGIINDYLNPGGTVFRIFGQDTWNTTLNTFASIDSRAYSQVSEVFVYDQTANAWWRYFSPTVTMMTTACSSSAPVPYNVEKLGIAPFDPNNPPLFLPGAIEDWETRPSPWIE